MLKLVQLIAVTMLPDIGQEMAVALADRGVGIIYPLTSLCIGKLPWE
jgi:hypothetical protein